MSEFKDTIGKINHSIATIRKYNQNIFRIVEILMVCCMVGYIYRKQNKLMYLCIGLFVLITHIDDFMDIKFANMVRTLSEFSN